MSESLAHESAPNPYQVLEAGKPLLQHFGVEVDPTQDTATFIEATKQLSPRYKEEPTLVRFQLEKDATTWSEDTQRVIAETAEAFDMLKPETPLTGDFTAVVALGGARMAPLDRARFAAKAIAGEQPTATAEVVYVAGSDRQLNEAEQAATSSYADGATTEFDLAVGAATTVSAEYPGVMVVALHVDGEKANNLDAVKAAITNLDANGKLADIKGLATVTTQIYQKTAALDTERAVREAGIITPTYAAGNPSDPNIVAKRTPATYLAEHIRTLQAAARAL